MITPVDILAIGVHPDDIELSCSGTLLKHKALGYSVGICDLTQGELGSRGSAELRLQEAERARIILGGEWRVNLGMADGFFTIDQNHTRKVIEVIRAAQPKIILANAPLDRHPDHGRAAKLVAEAAFYSGLLKIETTYKGLAQTKYRPEAVYHYVQDRNIDYDFVVDITEHMEHKMRSIKAYSSQFDAKEGDGPSTPISGSDFMAYMYAKNRAYGRDIGATYAEAFVTNRDLGVGNLFNLR
jgi:bacillithiol biosynthesis deacetylase BshB1